MEHPTADARAADTPPVTDLRRRADELGELARSIERSIVMTLSDEELRDASRAPARSDRDRLNAALLEANLHQLHRAADELRVTALRFRERADELDAASPSAA